MDEKFEYIDILLKKKENAAGFYFDLIIHGILNTIEISPLIDIYLSGSNSAYKLSLESNIFKRLTLTENPSDLYDRLYSRLESSNYHQRQRIRKILIALIPSLEEIYKEDFFRTFFYSRYIYDVNSALSMCGDIWCDSLERLILERYFETNDEQFLETLIRHGNIKSIAFSVKRIWSINPSNYLKIRLVRILSQKYFEQLSFLIEREPDKYLMAVSLAKSAPSNDILLDCLYRIDEENKPFGILSLSKLGKWDLIKNEIMKYVNL